MPDKAIFSVRGIGVAESVSTSTCRDISFRRSLWDHTEALLLVDDEKPELFEDDILLQQAVRTDDKVNSARSRFPSRHF